MAKRGRKVGSVIRDRLVELLFYVGEGYGYELYKKYVKVWGKVSMRSIYYHLRKGAELEIFKVKETKEAKGDYSWGVRAKRVIYTLGPNANPVGDKKVEEKLEK